MRAWGSPISARCWWWTSPTDPGSLGELARQLAAANVNIELLYTTFGGIKLVVATDDMASARAALA